MSISSSTPDSQSRMIDAVWDFFCSLKLTVVTLMLLAATSIIGTVIEQGKTPEEMAVKHGWNLDILRFLDKSINAFDMYHSWWFLALLGLFATNLICCSIKRLPRVMKIVREPVLVADDTLLRSLANCEEIEIQRDLHSVQNRAVAFLAERFADPVVTEQDGKVYLYAEKGAWARFGVYVTHLSILIIFIGAILGTLFGYKAYVNIVEGEESSQVWKTGSREPTELGFAVRCDKFSVSYYPDSTRPREFRSVLSVIENGKTVVDQRPIIVNDPLTYKGITFYQSGYGKAGEHRFVVSNPDGSDPQPLMIQSNGSAKLPNGSGIFLQEVTQDISQYQRGVRGPAAQVEVHLPGGNRTVFIVYSDNPGMNLKNLGLTGGKLLQYQGGEEVMYTGLQVAKDPGVEVVWAGCFLMFIGSMVAFCLSHRRIWVVLTPNGALTTVKLGGNAHRNQPAFEIFFDNLKKDFKNEFSS